MVSLLAVAASQLFQNATASTLMDETLKNGYPTLYAAASNDSNAIIRKFPFLTTFESLANALEDAGIIASSQQNPATLTKHQMAEKVEDYLDSFLNFSTGFIPKAIKDTYENNGYTMSQQDFWKNTPGLYKILEDPGNGASAVSLTSAGHHYVNAPTSVNCNAPADTAGVIANDITAQISATLATSSFISYADFTNDSTVDFVDVNTANSGIDSDDITGFSFEVDGGKGTDTSGSVLAMNLHYPMGLSTPGDTHIKADKDGRAGTSSSSTKQDVEMKTLLTPSEAELTSKSVYGATAGGYTGTITFHANSNVVNGSSSLTSTKCAVTHISAGVGFSGQSNNMSGDSSDVTPAFGLVFPHFADQPTKWSAPTSFTDIPIADLQATDSSYLPSDFDLTGFEAMEDGLSAGSTTSDGGTITFREGTGGTYQSWQNYNSAPSDSIGIKLNLTSNKLQIAKNGTSQLIGWGCAFFQFKVTYNSTSESATGATKIYNVAFHRLCNWTLDFARACPVVRTIGVGVTGNSTANVTDDSGATVGVTGFQGPFSLASATVATEGAGYDSSQSITCTLPTADGRFYQSIYGGKNITTRSNNNPTIKNTQATGTVSITNARVARQVETIFHDDKNFGFDGAPASSFKTRGFLGADSTFEKDDFARRLILNSSGQVTSIDTANATVNTTVGKDTAPGLLYDDETFHTTQNPHGDDTSYVANTFGTGSADEQYFAKDKGVFSVTISGGKVTAITPTARNDAAGVSCPGGFNYPDSSDYTQLTFIRNASVSAPTTFRNARVYYRANTAAANGVGKRATVDITDATQEFDAGSNLPDNFYSEAFAFGEGITASAVNPNTDFQLDDSTGDFTNRNWKPTLNPASVRIGVERPVLKTVSRSLKTKTVGTGAHRFTFEFEYPLMTQTEAEEIINLFDKYKGATNEIQLYIPSNAIKHLGAESADPGIIMSRRPVLIANAGVGSNEVVVDGFQDSATTTIPAGTHFTIQGQKKIYKVVQSGAADQYGRTELRIEPPLLTASTNFYLDTDNFLQDRRDYFLVRAFLEDDFLDYTVTADDLYKLSAIKFRESI